MKYVPSLPPPASVPTDRWENDGLTAVRPVKPVQERSLPPLIFHRRPRRQAEPEAEPVPAGEVEKRHATPLPEERRSCCRRTLHQTIPMELRSGTDRRRHNQRKTDSTEHIDEEA
jgi:hypothetical protein